MAIEVTEQFGRRLSDDNAELLYLITGTQDAGDARSALVAAAPSTYEGKDFDKADVDEADGVAGGGYVGTVRYKSSDKKEPEPDTNESTFSFDTSGEKQHIITSIATVNSYAASGTPGDHGNLIGVTNDSVEGTDIIAPKFAFTVTKYFAPNDVDQAYLGTLFQLTGTVNNAAFSVTTDDGITVSIDAGEGLLLGVRGRKRGDQDWELHFSFSARPNESNKSIGPITGISAKGWEYIWVEWKEDTDAAANAHVKVPKAAYVEQIYRETDWSQLGL